MTEGGSSQSQASYLKNIEEKPNSQASSNTQQLNQAMATLAMVEICKTMTEEDGEQFEDCLRALNSLFQKGYTHLFMTQVLLMRKMMNHFTKLGKDLEDSVDDTKTQKRMLFVLSVIAQILHHNPKFYYPFTRKFLLTVFSIDAELLQGSPIKDQILAILAVIFENLSRQPKLLKKYSFQEKLKQAVLQSYFLISEVFTLKTMDKTLSNMTKKRINISHEQFEKFKIMQTITDIISRNQMELFAVKMKMTMIYMGSENLKKAQNLQ